MFSVILELTGVRRYHPACLLLCILSILDNLLSHNPNTVIFFFPLAPKYLIQLLLASGFSPPSLMYCKNLQQAALSPFFSCLTIIQYTKTNQVQQVPTAVQTAQTLSGVFHIHQRCISYSICECVCPDVDVQMSVFLLPEKLKGV